MIVSGQVVVVVAYQRTLLWAFPEVEGLLDWKTCQSSVLLLSFEFWFVPRVFAEVWAVLVTVYLIRLYLKSLPHGQNSPMIHS